MLVRNNSARLHHVGNVSIVPLATAEIDDTFAGAISSELEVLRGPGLAADDPELRARAAEAVAPKAKANTNTKAAPVSPPQPAPMQPWATVAADPVAGKL